MLRLLIHCSHPQRAKRGQIAPSTPVGLEVGAGAGAQDFQDLGLAAARTVGQVPAVALVRQQRERAGPNHSRSPCQSHGLPAGTNNLSSFILSISRRGFGFGIVQSIILAWPRWREWICMHGRRHLMKVARRCTGSADAREACRVTVCENLHLVAPGKGKGAGCCGSGSRP